MNETLSKIVTDGPTTPPPAPKTPSASASPPAHDRAWAVDRLRILISQTLFSDSYREMMDQHKRGELDAAAMPERIAEMVAIKCGDDKVLIDAMEASLIPGLREVNDELAKSGKSLNVWMNGNRLAKLELVAAT